MEAKQTPSTPSIVLAAFLTLILLLAVGFTSYFVYRERVGGSKDVGDANNKPVVEDNSDKSNCIGAPSISNFNANPASIEAGGSAQLSWGAIGNTSGASINEGVGDVSVQGGSKTVSPQRTTTYSVEAKCGNISEVRQVSVIVGEEFGVSSVIATVNPENFSGSCPKTFNFTGNITVNKVGTVKYVWDKSDGSSTAEQSLVFDSETFLPVNMAWPVAETTSGWGRIRIISPNNLTSNNVVFNLNCGSPPANFSGFWYHNFGTANLTQTGSSVTGTHFNGQTGVSGTVAGSVSGNTLTGTWTISGLTGNFTWTMGGSGNTFDGNYNASYKWCGAKTGVNFPSGCSFAGSWNARVGTFYPCNMTITRKDNGVTGSYCNGSISGTVSFSSGDAVVNGTWNAAGTSGSFKWYMLGYGDKTAKWKLQHKL